MEQATIPKPRPSDYGEEVVKNSRINSEMGSMDDHIAHVSELVMLLEKSLYDILSPDEPRDSCCGDELRAVSSPLVEDLNQKNDKLRNIIDHLKEINDRLEV